MTRPSKDALSVLAFRQTVLTYWEQHGRHDLPWRKTKDPYKILISEVMLQQTQVPRVIEKYKEFLKAFPTVRKLADASLSDVLKVWSGVGYNRRAKFLREAAKTIVDKHSGKVPRDFAALRALPGVGDYTAGAVRVFAHNEPDALLETNIRAAYIHHFFDKRKNLTVSDTELRALAVKVAKDQDPRNWHASLMDYGTHIKKVHKNPARQSAHYIKQSKFEGSLRQVRGAILRQLQTGTHSQESLYFLIRANKKVVDRGKIQKALRGLEKDGLIERKKGKWLIT